MTSLRDYYRTPPELWAFLDDAFGFTWDLAADADNALTPRFSGPPHGLAPGGCPCGLCLPLVGQVVYCNPPYSDLRPWIARFYALALARNTVVAVLPLNPSATWFRGMRATAHEVWHPKHRIAFIHAPACTCSACGKGERGSPRGDNLIAIWNPWKRQAREPLHVWNVTWPGGKP